MKSFLLATVGLVALVGIAAPTSAADMAVKARPPAPVVAPIYDWTGFYIGANGGWGTSRKCWDFVTPAGTFVTAEGCHDADGGTVGGQLGYRWQAGTWVFGIEGQGNWADFQGSNESLFFPGLRNESRIDAFGLITGQVGYAANNVLFYVKGGAAVTADRFRVFDIPTGLVVATTGDDTRWGAVVGAGIEFGFAPNWSVGVEYNHLFMQDRTHTFVDPTGAFVGNDRITQDVDIVTARINYRFGGFGAPVAARY
ncbi:outer membrane immunogenic protein [Bradyrhizobium sp. AZCC 1678]|uniref:outer membrane protein n=1 Tax=Bradyrhizobium sp. AZCC 1678 TaxID=3117030 RepID=UPI002FF03032